MQKRGADCPTPEGWRESDFLVGLSVAETARVDWETVLGGAVERYRSHFLALAAKVPEFMIWALLGEGAATRAQVAGLRTDIAAALDTGRDALGRVELLLALDSSPGEAMPDLRAAVARANGGVLEQPKVPEDAQGYGPDITFPATGDIYISPRYRMVRAFAQRPADDSYFYEAIGPGDWLHATASWLIPAIAGMTALPRVQPPPEGTSERDIQIIADLIFRYLRIGRQGGIFDEIALQSLFRLPRVFRLDHEVIAAVAISNPMLLGEIPELRNPETYDRFAVYIEELFPEARQETLSEEARARGRDLLEQLSRTQDSWDFDDDQRP